MYEDIDPDEERDKIRRSIVQRTERRLSIEPSKETANSESNLLNDPFRTGVQEEQVALLEYQPDAEKKRLIQRISHYFVLCLLSSVALMLVCMASKELTQLLFSAFRFLLLPLKPFILAAPNPLIAPILGFVSFLSQVINIILLPTLIWLALRSSTLPGYLCVHKHSLVFLNKLHSVLNSSASNIQYYNGHPYEVLRTIPLSSINRIEIERSHGKKSVADYVLEFYDDENLIERIRWGDIVNTAERSRFLDCLDQAFPKEIDRSIFEPFRLQTERQSYTELWLRELSGAPKRDKLTPLSEGTKLDNGNYTVLKKAGVGGQGTVYLAQSNKQKDKDIVVLKEFVLPIYPDLRVRKSAAERFQKEAEMLGRLQHHQIAVFLDMFIEDHRAYLVLEHVNGCTLKELVEKQGPLPEKELLRIAKQITEILVYLHGQSPPVIHRDLTPDNIMLAEDGTVKLIDFSVAQELSSGVTGSVVGKPNYISPEQFRGKATTQSDIYSLGATLYFLLCAKDPAPISVLHPKRDIEELSDEIDEIIGRCTQLESTKRYENAELVLKALNSLSKDSGSI
ncbi:MAG: serine/threonine protein kinase [Candidatus Obscuribacterales bacterium]|nr:serine/threonine protein kinase [Candidatus Obscuribacterales bacterium]